MIIVRIWEGLGNQMFQYAYARAMREKGEKVRLDTDKAYVDAFALNPSKTKRDCEIQNFNISIPSINMYQHEGYSFFKQDGIVDKGIMWLSKHSLWKYKYHEADSAGFDIRLTQLSGNYYVKGWFQSERYFEDIREILLKEFRPRKKIAISNQLRTVLEQEDTVSIHVRRGDYVKFKNSLDKSYYKKAIMQIKQIYSNPTFLVFSDNLEWVKENISIDGKVIYVNEDGKYKDYEELFIMSRCKSNIIANSTFSWWAAWLNQNDNKYVIAPRKWFKSQDEILPKEWIVI